MQTSLSKRRILIAGGAGFLGSALTNFLIKQHAKVSWLVRQKASPPKGVKSFIWNSNKEWEKKSFTDLIIATGLHRLPIGQQNPRDIFETNVGVPFKLACWAAQTKVRHVIYISSGSVYEKNRTSTQGVDFYSSAKTASELLLKTFSNNYIFQIVRLFRPYGPGPDRCTINRILKNTLSTMEVKIDAPDGLQIQPIFLNDACAVIGAMLNIKKSLLINLAGKQHLTLGKLIRRWSIITQTPIKLKISHQKAKDDPRIKTTGLPKLDSLITTHLDEGLQIMRTYFNSINHANTRHQ